MTRRFLTPNMISRHMVWIALVLAVMAAGCAAGPPTGGVMMGTGMALSPGGNVGVAFGTGFGYAPPMSPQQRELMERRSRFYELAYDDDPYDWYWY